MGDILYGNTTVTDMHFIGIYLFKISFGSVLHYLKIFFPQYFSILNAEREIETSAQRILAPQMHI